MHCANAPACLSATSMPNDPDAFTDTDVESMRAFGWQVVGGKWACRHCSPARPKRDPGVRSNQHCDRCKSTIGGPYGHNADECTWTEAA